MKADSKIDVQVCYATPESQVLIEETLPVGSTIRDAVIQSGLLEQFSEIDLKKNDVGVFSERRSLDDELRDGDRVEIYRTLIIDPKDVRRKRAGKKASKH